MNRVNSGASEYLLILVSGLYNVIKIYLPWYITPLI